MVEIKKASAPASIGPKMDVQRLRDERIALLETRLAAVEAQLSESQLVAFRGQTTAIENERQEDNERMLTHIPGLEHARHYSAGQVEGTLCVSPQDS